MSKPRPIAFHELRVLPDQSRPAAPMPVCASAKPRNWWYREAFAGTAQGATQGRRGASVTPQPQPQLYFGTDSTLPPPPQCVMAPVEEDVGDEAPTALVLAAEPVPGQPGLHDMARSHRRRQWLSELTPVDPAPPVTAIARSISQASALLDVCALVVELCGGDRQRPAGTWEATLPLAQQGLGGTLLQLSLSPESLALRFVCDEPHTLDMLRPRIDELHRQLLQQLAPPLELTIDLELS